MTRIWELRDRQLRPFRGGYSAYLIQREEADARQRKDADTQAEQIAREKELIQRYRSHREYPKMHEHERRLERARGSASTHPGATSGWRSRRSAAGRHRRPVRARSRCPWSG